MIAIIAGRIEMVSQLIAIIADMAGTISPHIGIIDCIVTNRGTIV